MATEPHPSCRNTALQLRASSQGQTHEFVSAVPTVSIGPFRHFLYTPITPHSSPPRLHPLVVRPNPVCRLPENGRRNDARQPRQPLPFDSHHAREFTLLRAYPRLPDADFPPCHESPSVAPTPRLACQPCPAGHSTLLFIRALICTTPSRSLPGNRPPVGPHQSAAHPIAPPFAPEWPTTALCEVGSDPLRTLSRLPSQSSVRRHVCAICASAMPARPPTNPLVSSL
uniref:Uncharacterized protein n=1 Tax=Knipowitschia caucasica TaxID=637954 RepID=A0AAV2LY53_KNICA